MEFYKSGASAIFIAHWGTIAKDKIAPSVKQRTLKDYKMWGEYLKSMRFKKIMVNSAISNFDNNLLQIKNTENYIGDGMKNEHLFNKRTISIVNRINYITFPVTKLSISSLISNEEKKFLKKKKEMEKKYKSINCLIKKKVVVYQTQIFCKTDLDIILNNLTKDMPN